MFVSKFEFLITLKDVLWLAWWLISKEPACNARDLPNPELGRSHGEGNGNPLQHYCLGNPVDRGARWATIHGVAEESDMT